MPAQYIGKSSSERYYWGFPIPTKSAQFTTATIMPTGRFLTSSIRAATEDNLDTETWDNSEHRIENKAQWNLDF